MTWIVVGAVVVALVLVAALVVARGARHGDRALLLSLDRDAEALAGTPGIVLGPVRAECHGDVGLDVPVAPGYGTLILTADALLFRPRGGGPGDDVVLPVSRIVRAEPTLTYERGGERRFASIEMLLVVVRATRGEGRVAWTIAERAETWADGIAAEARSSA